MGRIMPAQVRNPASHWVRKGATVSPKIAGDSIAAISPLGVDRVEILHDDVNARIRWDDGYMLFLSDETANSNSIVEVRGNGTGFGMIRVHNGGSDCSVDFFGTATRGRIYGAGSNVAGLDFQHDALVPVTVFISSSSGETQDFRIYGYRAGDSNRYLRIGVGVDAADSASFDGLSDYLFGGNVNAANKIQMTSVGGQAIKLTNKTGANSVAGEVVKASTVTADAVALAGANELMAMGVFLETGIADGAEAWVVEGGIAELRMDAGGCALGDRIITSATAGRGTTSNTPAVAVHFQEIGHAVQAAGANANARVVLHFL